MPPFAAAPPYLPKILLRPAIRNELGFVTNRLRLPACSCVKSRTILTGLSFSRFKSSAFCLNSNSFFNDSVSFAFFPLIFLLFSLISFFKN